MKRKIQTSETSGWVGESNLRVLLECSQFKGMAKHEWMQHRLMQGDFLAAPWPWPKIPDSPCPRRE